ncbi:MAG: YceI family protein [Planctomycetes bacterium]|nr:YceI family protein [Planctomycetota bacterium]MCB9916983.1 YceI family protein [Planctomycetota bacterium]
MLRSFFLLPALLPALAFGLRHQDEAEAPDLRAGTTFAVDAMHSSVLFRVTHLKAGVFWGRFNDVKGTFKIDDDDLTESFVKVTIPVESVDTNSKDRDKHLLGPDFFNAKEYPTMSFESSKIERAGDKYRVHGTLELRGTKKDVVFDVTHNGTAKLSDRFGLRSGYEAIATINRTDFGVSYMSDGGALGNDVRIVIGVEGTVAEGK